MILSEDTRKRMENLQRLAYLADRSVMARPEERTHFVQMAVPSMQHIEFFRECSAGNIELLIMELFAMEKRLEYLQSILQK